MGKIAMEPVFDQSRNQPKVVEVYQEIHDFLVGPNKFF